jgi:hypothetical protein
MQAVSGDLGQCPTQYILDQVVKIPLRTLVNKKHCISVRVIAHGPYPTLKIITHIMAEKTNRARGTKLKIQLIA